MATKATTTVVANKAAIDQATAKNKANEAAKAAATAKAEAAKAKAAPLIVKSIMPSISATTSALNSLLKDLSSKTGTVSSATQKAITAAKTTKAAIDPAVTTELAGLTTTYKQAMEDVTTYSTVYDVPAAIYQEVLGTSGKAILKAKLEELQIPATMIDSSIDFVDKLVSDGVDYETAVDLYYNSKDFTTKEGTVVESPFYKEFTYLRDFAPKTGAVPSPLELMQFKLGVKNFVSKGEISPIYASEENIQKYIANEIRITDLDKRVVEAKIEAANADPTKVKTLVSLGYIKDGQGLADFYLDPTIGQTQFDINKNTAAFANQAMARAQYGLTFDAAQMKQLASQAGYTMAANATEVTAGAAKGFETVAQSLLPTTKLAQIYEKVGGTVETNAAAQKDIQTSLTNEAFLGTASERRKKLAEQEQLAYQARPGTITRGSGASGSLGSINTSGLI